MMQYASLIALSALSLVPSVVGHATVYHKAMYGLNVSTPLNRPRDPLSNRNFAGSNGWWFHGHINNPPNAGDFLEFEAGGETFVEIGCDKSSTSVFDIGPKGKDGTGTDNRHGNHICFPQAPKEFHANNLADVAGSAFAISYTPPSQVHNIQPADFVIFSVNHTSPWERFTKYGVPANMPECPAEGCVCAWLWIHRSDSGSEQMYMNGYNCKINNAKGTKPLAKPQIARRCGKDDGLIDRRTRKPFVANNCTYGAKQPLYWYQKELNNMHEGSHAPPLYNDLYGFGDGAQLDIFVDSVLPPMAWHGAPVTGKLQPVRGMFTGVTDSEPAPAPVESSSTAHGSKATPTPPPTKNSGSDPSPHDDPAFSTTTSKGVEIIYEYQTVTVTKTVGAGDSTETSTITPEEASDIISSANAEPTHKPAIDHHNVAPEPILPEPQTSSTEGDAPSPTLGPENVAPNPILDNPPVPLNETSPSPKPHCPEGSKMRKVKRSAQLEAPQVLKRSVYARHHRRMAHKF